MQAASYLISNIHSFIQAYNTVFLIVGAGLALLAIAQIIYVAVTDDIKHRVVVILTSICTALLSMLLMLLS